MVYRRSAGVRICKGLADAAKEVGKNDRGLFAAASKPRQRLRPDRQPPYTSTDRPGICEYPWRMADPFFTGVHKSGQGNVKAFLEKMRESWQFLPEHFVTSTVKKMGREKILTRIEEGNKAFERAS